MGLIVALIVILAFAIAIPHAKDSGPQAEYQADGQIVAQQQLKWHAAATHACQGGCVDGPIANVSSYLPDGFQAWGQTAGSTFHSFVSGSKVFTYATIAGTHVIDDAVGAATADLYTLAPRDVRSFVGIYVAATGTLSTDDHHYYVGGTSISATYTPVPIPIGLTDGTLRDGAPMIYTNSNYPPTANLTPSSPNGGAGCSLTTGPEIC